MEEKSKILKISPCLECLQVGTINTNCYGLLNNFTVCIRSAQIGKVLVSPYTVLYWRASLKSLGQWKCYDLYGLYRLLKETSVWWLSVDQIHHSKTVGVSRWYFWVKPFFQPRTAPLSPPSPLLPPLTQSAYYDRTGWLEANRSGKKPFNPHTSCI